MPGKEELKRQLEDEQRELEELAEELARAEAEATLRTCRYRNCQKDFITDDVRRFYCCPEHYRAENRERTKDRDELRRLTSKK